MLKETENFKKYFKSKDFELSDEQIKVCDFVQHGIGNGIIKAIAGSGKSTTIAASVTCIPADKKVLILSHNRNVRLSMEEKFKQAGIDITNIKIRTFHSLGSSLLFERHIIPNLKSGILSTTSGENLKYVLYIRKNLSAISEGETDKMGERDCLHYKTNLLDLINYSRYYLAQSPEQIKNTAFLIGVNCISNEINAAYKVLQWGKTEGLKGNDEIPPIDYQDLIWLPNELNIVPKMWETYDYVFVDEAQDASKAQQGLIQKTLGRSTRLFLIGDPYQAINQWCGSDIHAMDNIKKTIHKPWKEFKLQINRRSGKSILNMARHIAEKYNMDLHFIPDEKNGEGEIKFGAHIDEIQTGDMVLCRMTEPLFRLYIKFLKMGKPSYIKGENMKGIFNTIFEGLKSHEAYTMLKEMAGLIDDEIIQISRAKNITEDECINENSVLRLYQAYCIIETLSEVVQDKDKMKDIVDNAFIDTDDIRVINNAICLSTIHRAKGDEADNVYIICPSIIPSPFTNNEVEWQVSEEHNLEYVSVTRARKKLAYVDEQDISANVGLLSNTSLKKKINDIRSVWKNSQDVILKKVN